MAAARPRRWQLGGSAAVAVEAAWPRREAWQPRRAAWQRRRQLGGSVAAAAAAAERRRRRQLGSGGQLVSSGSSLAAAPPRRRQLGGSTATAAAAQWRQQQLRRRVDEHAKLKTQLKTKLSSQPRATSSDVDNISLVGAGKTIPRESRVTWGPTRVTWIPDESHVPGIPRPRDPTGFQ